MIMISSFTDKFVYVNKKLQTQNHRLKSTVVSLCSNLINPLKYIHYKGKQRETHMIANGAKTGTSSF